MKTPIILTAALLSALSVQARTLTPAEALSRVRATQTGGAMSVAATADDAVHVYTESVSGEDCVYVFNNTASSGGYFVVSASDKAVPMLGYSDTGSFSADNMPPNMRWWLGEYAKEILAAERNGLITSAGDIPEMSRSSFRRIAPKCATLWNQDAPYNKFVPESPYHPGREMPVGCVATAMAQVMKYFNWPPRGTGSSSYVHWDNEVIELDYSEIEFDWDNMLDRYLKDKYTEKEGDTVARLMYACAVSVETDFHPNGSEAVVNYVPLALVDYFGYDKGMDYYSRDLYGRNEWEAMIYENLEKIGPVIYAGQGSEGGHCFVCDGYASDSYFHINWGWGGMSDGYFLLSALDPAALGFGGGAGGFNYNQGAVLGCRPAVEGSEYVPLIGIYGDLFISVENNYLVAENLWNAGSFPAKIYPGFRLTAEDSEEEYYTTSEEVYSINGAEYYYFYEAPVPENLPDGTYSVRPVYYLASEAGSGDSRWRDILVGSYPKVRILVKEGDNITIDKPEIKNLVVTDVKVESPFYLHLPFKLSFKATNNNVFPVSESVQPLFTMFKGLVVGKGNPITVDLEAGETREFTVMFEFIGYGISPGKYQLIMGFVDSAREFYSEPLEVEVFDLPDGSEFKVKSFAFDNPDAQNPERIKVTYTVECTHGAAGGSLNLMFADYPAGSIMDYVKLNPFILTEGESATFTQEVSFSMGEPGVTYMSALFYGESQVTSPVLFTVAESGAIGSIEAEGDEIYETEIYNLSGVKMNPENLTPGLYIRRCRTKAGWRTEKVMIR